MELYYAGMLDSSADTAGFNLKKISDRPLHSWSLDDVREAIAQASSPVLGFADGNRCPTIAAWETATATVQRGECEAVVLYPAEGLLSEIWQSAPIQVACLAIAPTQMGAVAISHDALSRLLEELQSEEVKDPLWAILSQLAKNQKLTSLSEGAPCKINDLDLPKLAPAEPGRRFHWLRDAIQELTADKKLGDTQQRIELSAALFQLHGFLNASHEASQSWEGEAIADHWHAIMHRREPDYGNAKYWCRRVGQSDIFPELNDYAVRLQQEMATKATREDIGSGQYAGQHWDAFGFVDFCAENAGNVESNAAQLARQIQYVEMLLLLKQSL
ncbi:hypothetical protein Pla110_39560 [Polystyrenella longa]|uniref:Uncharacterized protein n=1 Tax=Polystyrenella longa TaxID=2528007 RepID=A0A518CSJ6_9PLAN|nr:hypothetical protein [Polystyrenella longa]QDU82201.1 hypothetical protein Pla110_39560 [Polystyrenella longa]